MTIGFLAACFAWTMWLNLDWRRFTRFYGVSGAPPRTWVQTVLRVFFALSTLSAADLLRRRLLERTRPGKFYWDAFLVAAVWFVAIVLMVKTVEWVADKRRKKLTQHE